MITTMVCQHCDRKIPVRNASRGHSIRCIYCHAWTEVPTTDADDDVVPRYLVLVDGSFFGEFDSESAALAEAARRLDPNSQYRGAPDPVEVVRSVRRWELDAETGEMLEVGEKLKEQPIRARINGMPVTLASIEFDPDGTLE
jgi:hypothetical protein